MADLEHNKLGVGGIFKLPSDPLELAWLSIRDDTISRYSPTIVEKLEEYPKFFDDATCEDVRIVMWDCSDGANRCDFVFDHDGLVTPVYFNLLKVKEYIKQQIAESEQSTTHKQPTTKGTTVMKEVLSTQLASNKLAATNAAKITAGKSINKKLAKVLKPKLPMMVRGYADHPLFSVVIANIVGLAIRQYMPDNQKAQAIADMSLDAAALQAFEGFDVEGMLDGLLDGVKLPKGMKAELAALDEED